MTSLGLDFGSLDLVSARHGGGENYTFDVVGEDVDFGQPQPVEVSVASLMADGAPTSTTRWDNREAGFQVIIEAPDSLALAEGEAALTALIGTRTTLAWTPPDGIGPTSVFQVETSSMQFLFSDLDEVRGRMRRTFRLRLVCLPWVHSVDSLSFGASPVSDTVTVVDECESTAGWSVVSPYSGTVSVDSTSGNYMSGTGSIKKAAEFITAVDSAGVGLGRTRLVKSGLSISETGGGFLVVRIKPSTGAFWSSGAGFFKITTTSGVHDVTPQSVSAEQNGFFRFVFAYPDATTITAFDAEVFQQAQSSPGSFWFDAIGTSAVNASAKQQVFSFDILGSARTEANLQVSASAGLGDVLLYTTPDDGNGFRPDLRRWLTAGTSAADANAVTGTRVALHNEGGLQSARMEASAAMFRPGAHAIVARAFSTSTGPASFTLTAQVYSGTTPVGPVERLASSYTFADANYHVFTMGQVSLPPLMVDPASGMKVRFNLYGTPDGTIYLDELLAFPMDESALTWVSCGTGTPSASVLSNVWLDAPSSEKPRGALLGGSASNRSDARALVPSSRGRHLSKPGRMLAYLMSSGSGATLSGTYPPAWHSNAGL